MQVSGFDDAKKNLLDNDSHYQKGGECESCRFQVLMMLKNNQTMLLARLLQQTFKG